jgi:hypothetical protein
VPPVAQILVQHALRHHVVGRLGESSDDRVPQVTEQCRLLGLAGLLCGRDRQATGGVPEFAGGTTRDYRQPGDTIADSLPRTGTRFES